MSPAAARPRRIVVIGGECTGKTTLASDLAARFALPWLPEASRLRAEQVALQEGRELTAGDVEPIAHLHCAAEDVAAASVVYARHYYGSCPPWIEAEARSRLADLYLLHAPDVPWISDGVRDRPSERAEIHGRFTDLLRAWRAPVVEVSGDWARRREIAEQAVTDLLAG